MWQFVQVNCGQDAARTAPAVRNKHAVCFANDGHIYLLGGKSKNSPLKDLWQFDSEQNHWKEIKCDGDNPPCLQNHSMNSWNDKLYVFGGEVGYNSTDTPLWQLNLSGCHWTKWQSVDIHSPGISGQQPNGRSGHSSLIYNNRLYVYGGYQQLNGTLSELWMFDLETEKWLFLSGNSTNSVQPASRHLHSAIIYQNSMYVYGGMSNLQAKGDFWKWSFGKNCWSKVKTGKSPGELHGHSAVRVHYEMFIFGGEHGGQASNELWRFNFVSESWSKIQINALSPSPCAGYVAIANPLFDLLELQKEQISTMDKVSPLDVSKRTTSKTVPSRTGSNGFERSKINLSVQLKPQKPTDSGSQTNGQCGKEQNETNGFLKESKCSCKLRPASVLKKLFRKSRLIQSKPTNSHFISKGGLCCLCNQNKNVETSPTNEFNKSTRISKLRCNCNQINCCRCVEVKDFKPDHSKTLLRSSTAEEKFDIGQLDEETEEEEIEESRVFKSSEEESQEELINRLCQLKKEDDDEPLEKISQTPTNPKVQNRFDWKKPRPKSELIAELTSLEEDIHDSWDGLDLKQNAVKSYYSLYFSSPSHTPNNLMSSSFSGYIPKSNANILANNVESTNVSTITSCRATIRTTPTSKATRPKSYQPDSRVLDYLFEKTLPNTDTNPISNVNGFAAPNATTQSKCTTKNPESIYSPTSVSSTMESISNSMSQSSGYQSLVDECDMPSFASVAGTVCSLATIAPSTTSTSSTFRPPERRADAAACRATMQGTKRYSNDCSAFDARLYSLQGDPLLTSWETESPEPMDSEYFLDKINSRPIPNSMSGGLELAINFATQQQMQKVRTLPRAQSFDKKLSRSFSSNYGVVKSTSGSQLWNQFHVIKEVIAPVSPAFRPLDNKNRRLRFMYRKRGKSSSTQELQLAMYVFGGKDSVNSTQAISIWKLYV